MKWERINLTCIWLGLKVCSWLWYVSPQCE